MKGGLNIALYLGIDFTSSNGVVTDPKSLHYVDPSNHDKMNAYQSAIFSAADILLEFDSDKMVPVYGFGANLNFPTLKSTGASHCFPCSGLTQPGAEEVFNITGIFDIYNFAIKHISLNGPTLFAPIFTKVLASCKEKYLENPDNYCFFMIITDGEIHDFDKTADVIVEACDYPISIVILGVGEESFQRMKDFDEGNFTDTKGRKPKRDIVRFVKFNEFKNSRTALSAEILKEIPTQVEEYYTSINKRPNPPKTPNRSFSHMPSAKHPPQTGMNIVPINGPNLAIPGQRPASLTPALVQLDINLAKPPTPYVPGQPTQNYPAAPS